MKSKFVLRSIEETMSEFVKNLYTANSCFHDTRDSQRRKFVVAYVKNNWQRFSLRSRGTKALMFLIDMNLLPIDLLERTPQQLEGTIHELKIYLNNIPDHVIEEVLR